MSKDNKNTSAVAADVLPKEEVATPVTENVSEEVETATKETPEEAKKNEPVTDAPDAVAEVVSFDLDGETFCFTEDCPAALRVENKVYTLAELCNHKDILTALVVGESGFVKKV